VEPAPEPPEPVAPPAAAALDCAAAAREVAAEEAEDALDEAELAAELAALEVEFEDPPPHPARTSAPALATTATTDAVRCACLLIMVSPIVATAAIRGAAKSAPGVEHPTKAGFAAA
jgi:hypothetical protein